MGYVAHMNLACWADGVMNFVMIISVWASKSWLHPFPHKQITTENKSGSNKYIVTNIKW
jgi:hypothetical protein